MTNYKLINDAISGRAYAVLRSDGWQIPFDDANTDYQEYLKWVAEGNQPLPPDAQTGQNTPIQE